MSGAFSGITNKVKKIASKNSIGNMTRDAADNPFADPVFRAAGETLRKDGKSDTEILEQNPTTPLSESDTATQIADPLNLTGEPEADAVRKAEEEAKANYRPTPLPDADEIKRVRRNQERKRQRRGRASTSLSDYGSDAGLGG